MAASENGTEYKRIAVNDVHAVLTQEPQTLSKNGNTSSAALAAGRFYPDAMPAFPYEPTRDRFGIVRVGDGVGEGVIACVGFQPGEIIFGFTGFFSEEITQFSLQVHEGLHLHDPYFMGKVLHSCEPNASCDMERRLFVALKPINPGDFITMDYAETEDILFKTFECACGAEHCRGVVKGRNQ